MLEIIQTITIYPKITIRDNSQVVNNQINVGGIVGTWVNTNSQAKIKNSKVYFVKTATSRWQDKADIYVDSNSKINLGGLVGLINSNNLDIINRIFVADKVNPCVNFVNNLSVEKSTTLLQKFFSCRRKK